MALTIGGDILLSILELRAILMFTGLRLRATSTLLDQICNQLRARLETVADELVHVSRGQGAFSDPSGVDMNCGRRRR